jgi:integrase
MKAAVKWAVGAGALDALPALPMPPMEESRVEHLTKAEFRQFLEGCEAEHVRLFAILAVTTGARTAAILQLTWPQVDLARCIADFNPPTLERRKHKTRAIVPLNGPAMQALREAVKVRTTDHVIEYAGRPIASIKTGVRLASERSRVPVHPHMFRHSAAVWMAEARVPLDEIARFLGHSNVEITRNVYAKFNPDYLQQAATALDWED